MAGDVQRYGNYVDYQDEKNMFAMTSPMAYQRDEEANRFFTEILPIDKEGIKVWLDRTAKHTVKLTEYSRHHHIYGTKRTWSCHTSSRYCFICTLCDFVDVLRMFCISISQLFPKEEIKWNVEVDKDDRVCYTLKK